jgi:hypothetical protein
VATLTVTGANNLPQSYELTRPTYANRLAIDISKHGVTSRSFNCGVENIDPVFVSFVSGTNIIHGWLCISPSDDACTRQGTIDCIGGDQLGFLTAADSDIGSCSSLKACKKACSKNCRSANLKRDGAACTDQICKCRCIDRSAGSAVGPGDAQCYLGVQLALTESSDCTSPRLVDFGSRCFPMTTSSSGATLAHADGTDAEILGPLSEFGAALPLTCQDAFSSRMRSGLVMNGQVAVISGAAPSDVILNLHMPCGPPRFVDNGDGTVTDLLSGLQWEKKDGNDDGIPNYADPHDNDNIYFWCSGVASCTNSANPPDGTAYTDFLSKLNTGCFAGHCDWRLPSIVELLGILDVTQGFCGGGYGACIDPAFGLTSLDGGYYSATSDAIDPTTAWDVDFTSGYFQNFSKWGGDFVRAVRGGPPLPRYLDNGDGTVTDLNSGLQWEKKDNSDGIEHDADPHDADNRYTWSASGTAADGTAYTDFLSKLNTGCFAGHCDWRLPSLVELQGILDVTQGFCGGGSGACIDPAFGPTQAFTYWSTETTFPHSDALGMDFSDNALTDNVKTNSYYVRAVRGGL